MLGENYKNRKKGFALIETLIGVALFVLVLFGIFGLIRLSFKLVAQSKARTTATALANQKIELAHNLPYTEIGTIGGVPTGAIPEKEIIVRNNVTYEVKTTVTYVDDPFDNSFPNDPLPWDYKRVKVAVSWTGFLAGQVFLLSDVAPKGIETTGGGGIISILIFDANGQPVPQAAIHIENTAVNPAINANYQSDNQGRFFLPGAPACNDCYKITATKSGYSLDRTYQAGEQIHGQTLAVPSKPFVSVLEGQMSEASFAIDRLSTKTIRTLRYAEEKNWEDLFNDQTKISQTMQVTASTTLGHVQLEQAAGEYYQTGYLISETIVPTALVQWGRLSWNQEAPGNTALKYHLLYSTSSAWELIPDEDLTFGTSTNSVGFSNAPVDLLGLDPARYPSVRLKADFRTTDVAQTPTLFDWQITWFSSDTNQPLPNLPFTMRGAKTLGQDQNGNSIYKYQEGLSTDANAQITIADLEWDAYLILVNATSTNFDIANSLPPQPLALNPESNATTIIRLAEHENNSLLLTIKNSVGEFLPGASLRLYKIGYDQAKLASESGQAFFSPLEPASYMLEAKLAGYQDWLDQIEISGQAQRTITLMPPD